MTTTNDRSSSPDFSILSANAFEELCLALLVAAKYELVPSGREEQRYGDFKGTTPGSEGAKSLTVEVKHRDKFDAVSLRQFLRSAVEINSEQLLYVTSAPIDHNFSSGEPSTWVPHGKKLTLIGREELRKMLLNYPAISERFFAPAKKRDRLSRAKISASLVVLVMGAISAFVSLYLTLKDTTTAATLPAQIAAVQQSLDNIRNLQSGLRVLQKNLDDTAVESRQIELEYSKAQQLKNLTSADLEEVKEALNHSSWKEKLLDGFIGFVIGVAGSLVAAWLYERWTRWSERRGTKE